MEKSLNKTMLLAKAK